MAPLKVNIFHQVRNTEVADAELGYVQIIPMVNTVKKARLYTRKFSLNYIPIL